MWKKAVIQNYTQNILDWVPSKLDLILKKVKHFELAKYTFGLNSYPDPCPHHEKNSFYFHRKVTSI